MLDMKIARKKNPANKAGFHYIKRLLFHGHKFSG